MLAGKLMVEWLKRRVRQVVGLKWGSARRLNGDDRGCLKEGDLARMAEPLPVPADMF